MHPKFEQKESSGRAKHLRGALSGAPVPMRGCLPQQALGVAGLQIESLTGTSCWGSSRAKQHLGNPQQPGTHHQFPGLYVPLEPSLERWSVEKHCYSAKKHVVWLGKPSPREALRWASVMKPVWSSVLGA